MTAEALKPSEPRYSPELRLLGDMWQTTPVTNLKNYFEWNRFHGGPGEENVMTHTARVSDAAVRIIDGRTNFFEDQDLQKRLQAFFVSPVGSSSFTRGYLQEALAITHDIGKGVEGGMTINTDGTTGSAGHEQKSAAELPKVFVELERNDHEFPEDFKRDLAAVVEKHGIAYPILLFDEPEETKDLPLEQRLVLYFVNFPMSSFL